MEEKYLTIKQAAKLLGVTPLTLRNWDKKGLLAAYRHPLNNYRLYRHADIEDLLARLEQSRERPTERTPPDQASPAGEVGPAENLPTVQRLQVRFEDEV